MLQMLLGQPQVNVHFAVEKDEEPHRVQDKQDFADNFVHGGFGYFDAEIHSRWSLLNVTLDEAL